MSQFTFKTERKEVYKNRKSRKRQYHDNNDSNDNLLIIDNDKNNIIEAYQRELQIKDNQIKELLSMIDIINARSNESNFWNHFWSILAIASVACITSALFIHMINIILTKGL